MFSLLPPVVLPFLCMVAIISLFFIVHRINRKIDLFVTKNRHKKHITINFFGNIFIGVVSAVLVLIATEWGEGLLNVINSNQPGPWWGVLPGKLLAILLISGIVMVALAVVFNFSLKRFFDLEELKEDREEKFRFNLFGHEIIVNKNRKANNDRQRD